MGNIDAEIITERLLLRQYLPEDAESVHSVINNKEISEFMPAIPYPYPRDTVDWWINFVNNRIKEKTSYELGIFLRANQQYIGNCELGISKNDKKQAYIGYFIDPLLWNNGYASEAIIEMIKFGFNELSLDKIIGRCLSNNIGSRRVLGKAGFDCVSKKEEYIKKWDKVVEINYLEIEKGKFEDIIIAHN